MGDSYLANSIQAPGQDGHIGVSPMTVTIYNGLSFAWVNRLRGDF